MRVVVVQQGAWRASLPTMPLAAGYLKAAADAHPRLATAATVEILNLPGGCDVRTAAIELLSPSAPDVVAFSVLGWNARSFFELARTYKQVRPDGLVVVGGNHVTNQAERVFRICGDVDVVVNGEGEATFTELLLWNLDGRSGEQLASIDGISFRWAPADPPRSGDDAERLVTTTARRRRDDLDTLVSPFLSGAIPVSDPSGAFRYDVALMETNRGCPYRCSFCYWGGAVGARVHEFSRERLRSELEHLGSHGVETVVLCDANFGMRHSDLRFVADFIDVRDRLGAPRYLEASWTKNKSETFYEIVRMMAEHRLTSSFTLALQSLDGPTLDGMRRRNMRINEWLDITAFLRDQGMDCYAELIWGAPGESPTTFFAGYDRLARVVPRIAVYPLLLIPNTEYDERRDELGIVTVRGQDDDFEYVLSHPAMTIEENVDVQRFVFWARVLAENSVLRWCWTALRLVPDVTQSEALRAFADRVERADVPEVVTLRSHFRPFADSSAVVAALRYLHANADRVFPTIREWWARDVVARADESLHGFLREVLDYDWLTRPVYDEPGSAPPLPVVELDGEEYYVRPPAHFGFDVPAVLGATGAAADTGPGSTAAGRVVERPTTVEILAKVGFHGHLENHEVARHFVGRPRERSAR